ncbi:MAG: hypothetical protein J6P81_02290 [Spirochaetales bacterium]|nr:hypothetical protein [Spirochaetales bacterium]
MKKAFYLLILIVLCVSLFVSCESDVKKTPFRVGRGRYDSLMKAVTAASDGGTIYLEEDAETKGCIISKNITLDLQENTLTLNDSMRGIYVFSGSTLILDGNGYLTAGDGFTGKHLLQSSGDLKILNANVSAQGYETGAIHATSGSVIIFGASNILADEGQEVIHSSGSSYCYIYTTGKLEGTIKTADTSVIEFVNADLSTKKLKFDYSSSIHSPIKAIRVSTKLYETYDDTFKAVEEAKDLLAYDHEAGIVFFDTGRDDGEWRYLMAAHADLRLIDGVPSVDPNAPGYAEGKATFNFGHSGTDYGTNIEIGAGLDNTTKLANEPTDDSGAKYCADLTLTTGSGTYSDWFLPSFDELNSMYEHLHNKGAGGFDQELYLSSSEIDASAMDTAAALYFNGWERGELAAPQRETEYLAVRPVRRF